MDERRVFMVNESIPLVWLAKYGSVVFGLLGRSIREKGMGFGTSCVCRIYERT